MRLSRSCGLITAILLLGSAGQVRADFVTDTLGSASPGNYAILNIGTGKADVALTGPGTTTGNVGVLSGTLSLASSTPPAVVGDVFLGSNVKANFNASKQVQGNVFTGSFEVTLDSGEHLTGSFGPADCGAVQELFVRSSLTCQ